MSGLIFGTAGIPESTRPETTRDGIRRVATLGLQCMELAFVRGVYLREAEARAVAGVASNNHVQLSAHAPYYLNLNSPDPEKLQASRQRILSAARIASICGANAVVFHPGFYMGQHPDTVYEKIKAEISTLLSQLADDGNPIRLLPEIGGKSSQFGTVDEILRLSADLPRVAPCLDFAHWHARSGKFNSYDEFAGLLNDLKKKVGPAALENIHIHVSGIEYGPRGERRHVPLQESDLRYEDMVRAWKDSGISGRVICESPNREDDALFLQALYRKMT